MILYYHQRIEMHVRVNNIIIAIIISRQNGGGLACVYQKE